MSYTPANQDSTYFRQHVNTIAVVGLGLLGGSVALRLKELFPNLRILGLARRDASVQEAIAQEIIDDGAIVPESVLPLADLTLLCTPVTTIVELAERHASLWPSGAVVTDVGSVKGAIVEALTPILAAHEVSFVGSHPMAGSEKSGLAHAAADLYDGSNVLITPESRTDPQALKLVTTLWRLTGATPVELPAALHDRLLGRTSHLIHLLAAAAVDVCLKDETALQVTGGGFRDFSRIASSSPRMWRQIFEMNSHALLEAVQEYQTKLQTLTGWIKNENWDELEHYIEMTGRTRDEWFKAWSRSHNNQPSQKTEDK